MYLDYLAFRNDALGGVFARVSLIDKGDLDTLAGFGLHSLGEFCDLSPILLVCSRHT
jgi:hypothetical protein